MSDIILYRMEAARVLVIPNEPGNLVLAVTSGSDVTHYVFTIDELGELARRLTDDVRLMQAGKGKRAS